LRYSPSDEGVMFEVTTREPLLKGAIMVGNQVGCDHILLAPHLVLLVGEKG
jgi:hypothetical protein